MLVGMSEIARHMGRHRCTIWRWQKRYGFPAVQIGPKTSVSSERLIEDWLVAHEKVRLRLEKLRDEAK